MQQTADWSVEFIENESRRMQIIKEGFTDGLSGREVNRMLTEHYCEALYPRNLYEAVLIYCLDHGKSYDEWRDLVSQYDSLYPAPGTDTGTVISLSALRKYVASGNENEEAGGNTALLTRAMYSELETVSDDDGFLSFLMKNRSNFSSVREKARYYFAKYILYYIDEKTARYLDVCDRTDALRLRRDGKLTEEEKEPEKAALEELSFLKPLKPLQRSANTAKINTKNYMNREEKEAWLEQTTLTSGGIFDAMNSYYFGYISLDWLELCMEMYPYLEDWPNETKRKIAEALGLIHNGATPEEEALVLDGLAESIRQTEEAMEEGTGRNAAGKADGGTRNDPDRRNRRGANAFRDFLLGKTDINRRTLIMFLLFVNANTHLDKKSAVTLPRLNHILAACGFSQLRPDMEFDRFVMGFMKSSDPISYFEDAMENRIKAQKDTVLYSIYEASYNHQKELVRDMIRKKLL